jgi:hypothetical protein
MRSFPGVLLVLWGALTMAAPALAGEGDTGTVVVINESDFTLGIHVNGTSRFTLRPGARQAVEGLTPGVHSFKALTGEGQVKFSKDLRVAAGQKLSWYLKWSRSEGAMVVENANGVPLAVFVDGLETLGVAPGDERVYGNLPPGPHDIQLAYLHREELHELLTTQVVIASGEAPVVIAPPMDFGAIAVRNDSAARLRVVIDGAEAGWLEPGERGQFEALGVGAHRIRVVDERGQLVRHRVIQVDVHETALLIVPSRHSSSRDRSYAGRDCAVPALSTS